MIFSTPCIESPPSQPHALDHLTRLLNDDLQAVNALILEKSQSSVDLIATVAHHLIASGGKRIRPLLTLASARLFNYKGENHILLATAVEFIHTATLLHDDVVDRGSFRRGRKTANLLWGNETSVLVGDFLFSQAFTLMVETKSLEALEVLSAASATIAQGEVQQLMSSQDRQLPFPTYLEIIGAKTAELFKAACDVGALSAQQSTPIRQNIRDYGHALGVLFQLTDDLLDYFGDSYRMGKAVGHDFKEKKMTLPLILLCEKSSPSEKQKIKDLFQVPRPWEFSFEEVLKLMAEKEIFLDCKRVLDAYALKAKASLKGFPEGDFRPLLEGLVDYCTQRGG